MPVLKVTIKWGREVYSDVEVNTDEEPAVFKALIYSLTGVNPMRQKVMVKGKTLGDQDWSNFSVTSGCTLLLMGTKEEDIVSGPVEKVKFVEDMNEAELATALDLPLGIQNLGNTCYMNATVQCLKTVPPLATALALFEDKGAATTSNGNAAVTSQITLALRDLYKLMDKGINIPPLILLNAVHTAFPRFAERSEHGGYAQQDANECWTEVVRVLQQKLPAVNNTSYQSVIDQYFGGRLAVEWKCNDPEAVEEEQTNQEENFLQLSCFITPEVRYMHSGLKEKLEEKITKRSPTLDRDAEYTKTSKLARLPAYLTIQMVRFFYKEKQSTNAKILKDVKFPVTLDVFDLCSRELQEKLIPMRDKFKVIADKEAETKVSKKDEIKTMKDKVKTTTLPYSFENDLGSNNSGFYELQAVLTHKGRSSSSGHYVAWVRHKEKHDIWLKCDDDDVTAVHTDDVLKLSGGGDWHIAYVLLYGPKVLEIPEGVTMPATAASEVSTEEKMPID